MGLGGRGAGNSVVEPQGKAASLGRSDRAGFFGRSVDEGGQQLLGDRVPLLGGESGEIGQAQVVELGHHRAQIFVVGVRGQNQARDQVGGGQIPVRRRPLLAL